MMGEETKKLRVMIFIDWFLPGYKAGGPIRSVANLVEALYEQYDFSIVTTDRDLGDKEAYEEIETDTWIDRDQYRVWYASPNHQSYRHLRNIVFNNEFDVLYCQSMFSLKYTLFPPWTCRALRPESKMVLAPRGMLHKGAIGLKSRKKKLFLKVFRLLQLHKAVTFQATDDQEEADIRKWMGEMEVVQVKNVPRPRLPEPADLEKQPGKLRLVFFSRLTIKKGVHQVLEALAGQEAEIELDLYGVQDEPEYWERCQGLIAELPSNIQVAYRGTVPPQETSATLQQYHAFVMPTQGENFGHAIFEALAAGRPVVISDQTPWRGLEEVKAGWDLPLDDTTALAGKIRSLAGMDQESWNELAAGARQHAGEYLTSINAPSAYEPLFSLPKNL